MQIELSYTSVDALSLESSSAGLSRRGKIRSTNRPRLFSRIVMALGFFCIAGPGDAFAQPRTRSFHADISSEEEAKVKPSNGTGTADITVDLATLKLAYKVTFSGLTSDAIGISLHGPIVRGVDGPIFLDLVPNGIRNPLEGVASLSEAEIQYLLLREVYVNIRTRKYEEGEIRGYFERRPDQPMP